MPTGPDPTISTVVLVGKDIWMMLGVADSSGENIQLAGDLYITGS